MMKSLTESLSAPGPFSFGRFAFKAAPASSLSISQSTVRIEMRNLLLAISVRRRAIVAAHRGQGHELARADRREGMLAEAAAGALAGAGDERRGGTVRRWRQPGAAGQRRSASRAHRHRALTMRPFGPAPRTGGEVETGLLRHAAGKRRRRRRARHRLRGRCRRRG
jgi:hypothetical protein